MDRKLLIGGGIAAFFVGGGGIVLLVLGGLILAALFGSLLMGGVAAIGGIAESDKQEEEYRGNAQCVTSMGGLTDDDDDDDNDESSSSGAPAEYEDLVSEAAREAGFSTDVIAAQIEQESGWDENAESPAGARGIAQFMPGTWEEYGDGGDITDPEDAIPAQGRYMGELAEMMQPHADDDEELLDMSLAAYNAGPGALEEYDYNLDDMLADYSETRDYIPSIRSGVSDDEYSGACAGRYGLPTATGSAHDTGSGNDDYPYADGPAPVGSCGATGNGNPECDAIWETTTRQCTSLVLWRINQGLGYTTEDFEDDVDPYFTWSDQGMRYPVGAGSWGTGTDISGNPTGAPLELDAFTMVDGDPQPGDIAWWDFDDIGGGWGHVGWVMDYDSDAEVAKVEHYNLEPEKYSTSEEDVDEPTGYIRIDYEKLSVPDHHPDS